MQVSRYHSFLRVSLLVLAFILVFDSGIVSPVTKQLSSGTMQYLASVGSGVFASVPQNEINSLTAQISERERELDAREAQLNEREIATRNFGSEETDYSTYIISIILFIITVLLVLNYVMDWNRARKFNSYEKSTA